MGAPVTSEGHRVNSAAARHIALVAETGSIAAGIRDHLAAGAELPRIAADIAWYFKSLEPRSNS